jgi:amino acid transporter
VTSAERPQLARVLGPTTALCVIVGSVIGSGIFLVPARVAQLVPALGPILVAWTVGGLFSLAGALTLAELAARMPRAGGSYVYLKETYGPLPAFLFGWTEFLIVRSGSMATLASAFAIYAAQLFEPPAGWNPLVLQCAMAVSAMALVGFVNVLGTRWGGGLQVVGTVLKVGALLTMIVLPFVLQRASATNLTPVWKPQAGALSFLAFMQAMVSVLWAYDGWVNSASLAEEIRDPERNIPRTLIAGVFILIALYVGMTVVYHMVLPMEEIAAASTEKGSPRAVSADFFRVLLGARGQVAISLIVMASTFIALNGNVLAGPRVYFAMARDGVFPTGLARVSPRHGTPARAIVAQTVWAIALAVAATVLILVPPSKPGSLPAPVLAAWTALHETPLYDFLYNYVIFGATIFYMLSIVSVFHLRRTTPGGPGEYRTWGYPVTPLVFVAGALVLLGSMLVQTPLQSFAGLGIVLIGVPAYALFQRRAAQSEIRSPS